MAVPKRATAARVEQPRSDADLPDWARSEDPAVFLDGFERLFFGTDAFDRETYRATRRKAVGMRIAHPDISKRIYDELVGGV